MSSRSRKSSLSQSAVTVITVAALALIAGAVYGQASTPAVFVCNNGNLEGSVSSFVINPNGSLEFVDVVVTGTRPSLTVPCPYCNAYEISLTPDGAYLALTHPAGDLDGLSILRVETDASLTLVVQLTLPVGQDGPLDVQWLDHQHLAVLRTGPSPDQVAVYVFHPGGPSLTFSHAVSVGTSGGYLALHPTGQYLYASNSSTPRQVYAFAVGPGASLTQIDVEPSGTPFPLEVTVSPDGTKLYAAGGISGTGHDVIGMTVNPDGTLTAMSGSPFYSPGQSPSNVFVSGDNGYCIVGHGTDATVRVLAVNPLTGALTDTGHSFDVGMQGTLGDVRVLDDLLFVTDNSDGPTGVYSFTIGAGGALTQNGALLSTSGISPRSIATWAPPPVPGDLDDDGDVDIDDFALFVDCMSGPEVTTPPPGCAPDVFDAANLDTDADVDLGDFAEFENAFTKA
ncbi:MAG TPA: beta-propeller fold lactonase family protein [Phycisphaerae bacterium]|nr:beta-propeller fold lactonase family protein [Phycisphaerae bacterium]HNU45552.1 beta-propeller fold lactonase family protein [Phycisphaerae bacterium]